MSRVSGSDQYDLSKTDLERQAVMATNSNYVSKRIGYTGHMQLDRSGFIHMQGRLYDPVLGRFLSPDPIVLNPTNSQNWNKYSYVLNNSTKYTDPSGYAQEAQTKENCVPYANANGDCAAGQSKAYDTHIQYILINNPFGTDSYGILNGQLALTRDAFQQSWAERDAMYGESGAGLRAERTFAQKESFASYFGERVMSGRVRDDIFTFGGSLVSSFTFGVVEPSFVDRDSSAFEVGQVTSLGLGGAGLIRSVYFGGTKGLSALASASGSESIVLGLSGFRNFTKLATNPALWFNSSLRSAHVVPASVRLQNAGSVQALASKIGSTNTAVDATLIPLTPFVGAAFND